MKNFELTFNGYYPYDFHQDDSIWNELPFGDLETEIELLDQYVSRKVKVPELKTAGIYCIYAGVPKGNHKVQLKRLIYIGQSDNIYNRLEHHEKMTDFCRYLMQGESLYISFAELKNSNDRDRVEAALIYYHEPPCNTQNTQTFNYPDTSITLRGETCGLVTNLEIKKIF